jgi:hypothetical protein
MEKFSAEIQRVRAFVIQRGYQPGAVVDVFTRGSRDETLVVHFAEGDPRLLGDEKYAYFDTPSGICAMLNLDSGNIVIPESL